jgi:hypothetical protein
VQTTACGGNDSGEEAAVDEHVKLKTNRGDAQNITKYSQNITFTISNQVCFIFGFLFRDRDAENS